MFYQLPPSGNHIVWKPQSSSFENIRKKFKPYNIFFYNSGTESLAAALLSTIITKNIDKPEVLLPAYSCPELVSAILFTGAKPILIDLEHNKPWLSIQELHNKITVNTVAVIAVNLFGIPEQLNKISEICKKNNIFLIEDSAQAFPDISDDKFWKGDFIVLSFGRGKPVSTLGGGAILCKNDNLIKHLPVEGQTIINRTTLKSIIYRTKIFLYNILLYPYFYLIPHNLPFLKLGETIFKPLKKINSIYKENISILDSNIDEYNINFPVRIQQLLTVSIPKTTIINVSTECNVNHTITNLVRYPVLLNSRIERDELYKRLNDKGLGASKMYQKPLNEIEGLKNIFKDQFYFPNAKHFSDTLLTLPIHRNVTPKHIKMIKAIFDSI